ncbi:CBS domain-containing protein [Jatrophihabitans fulvus]
MSVTVGDVMHRHVEALHPNDTFKHVVEVLTRNAVRAAPVFDDTDRVVGVVSESDLMIARLPEGRHSSRREPLLPWHRHHTDTADTLDAAVLMSSPAVLTTPDATVLRAARTAHSHDVRQLPVVSPDGTLVGMVTRLDLLGVHLRDDDEIRAEITSDVLAGQFSLTPGTVDVTVHDGVVTLIGRLGSGSFRADLRAVVTAVRGVVSVVDHLTAPPDARRPDDPFHAGVFY